MAACPSDQYLKESYGSSMISSSISLCSLALLLVCYRFGFIYHQRGWFGIEECMVICSLCSLILFTVCMCFAARNGFGHHQRAIPFIEGGNLQHALKTKYFWVAQASYKIAICFNKLAFLTLYLRVFTDKRFRIICWLTIGLIVNGSLAFVVATIAQCDPVSKNWDKTAPGHCINNGAFRWCWAAFNTSTDLWVAFLAVPQIIKLHMSTPKKVGTAMILGLGLFTCGISAFRMRALVQSTTTTDTSHDSAPAFIWTDVEAAVGLICTCLPSLKPLISRCFPRTLTQWSNSEDRQARRANVSHRLKELATIGSIDRKKDNVTREAYDAATHTTTTRVLAEEDEDSFSSGGRGSQDRIVGHAGIMVKKDISVMSDAHQTPQRHSSKESYDTEAGNSHATKSMYL